MKNHEDTKQETQQVFCLSLICNFYKMPVAQNESTFIAKHKKDEYLQIRK